LQPQPNSKNMDIFLCTHVPYGESYLEVIFKHVVTPWYHVHKQRAAAVYTRISEEMVQLQKQRTREVRKKQVVNACTNIFDKAVSNTQTV